MKKKSDLGSAVKQGLAAAETTALASLFIAKAKKLVMEVLSSDEAEYDSKADKKRLADMGATIAPVQPRLIALVPGKGLGEAYAVNIKKHPVVIGRESSLGQKPDVGLSVPNVVSRRHIEIASEAGRYTLKPIAMDNVTCLNGRIVPNGTTVPLKDGDLIGLSADGYFFVFRCTALPIHMLPVFANPDRVLSE